MIHRYFTICLLFVAVSLIPQMNNSAEARSTRSPMQYQSSRNASIRRMPLMQRPNHSGHFIGNTIRNNARRGRGRR